MAWELWQEILNALLTNGQNAVSLTLENESESFILLLVLLFYLRLSGS